MRVWPEVEACNDTNYAVSLAEAMWLWETLAAHE